MPAKILQFDQGLDIAQKACEELMEHQNSPIVLIDGRAGAGKSHFAKLLAEKLFQSERQLPKLIHMDDLYPGWEGLRAGSQYLNHNILEPINQGKQAHWQIWDWATSTRGAAGEPSNGWRSYDGGNLVIVEGCGSVSEQSRKFAQLCIWIESDLDSRRARFSDRDQGVFDEYFALWSIQEDDFYSQENSQALCDLVISN